MKRFVVMGGAVYYACGGFEDYLNSFNTKEEAETFMKRWLEEAGQYHWAHYADTETGEYWSDGRPEATISRITKGTF